VRKMLTMAVALLVTVGALVSLSQAGPAPDATVKKVMKAAMKGGLLKKVADGKADEKQKKDLLDMFESLAKADPVSGEKASWDSKTKALVVAAQAAVDGKADSADLLKKAATCKACHDVHKGK
jgi:surface antigen